MTIKPATPLMTPKDAVAGQADRRKPAPLPRVIVLIGLMGAGKTTIGRRLAHALDLPFIDADQEIERAAGCSVSEIFDRHGEAAFREGERRVIQRLLDGRPMVLATGGGAFMNPQTRQIIRENGHSVWLRCPLNILRKRLEGRPGRPLLADGNISEVLETLRKTRHHIYAEADIIVDCGDETVRSAVERVVTALSSHNPPARLPIALPDHPYDIVIGSDVLDRAGALLAPILQQRRAVIVTDARVAPLYLSRLEASLHEVGFETHAEIIPGGEESKSFTQYAQLCENVLTHGVERRTAVIGLGGGVVGDLSGFVAATLLRGVPFVQIPTTLLAQVDSSVGGKTGINTARGKNLVGAFHQPSAVLTDTSTLRTLPRRERVAGYAEIVKAGLIGDRDLFTWCEANGAALLEGDEKTIQEGVRRACAFKASVVLEDEREISPHNGRALLNLGHSFGHGLEAEFHYDGRLLHGEAVSIGLHLAASLSVRKNYCDASVLTRVDHHLKAHGMPCTLSNLSHRLSAARLITHMARDKKMVDRRIMLILLHDIGEAFTTKDVDLDEVKQFLISEGCDN